MAQVQVRFKKDKETKGAVKYNEVDDQGKELGMQDGKVGTMYVRKNLFNGSSIPNEITATFDW